MSPEFQDIAINGKPERSTIHRGSGTHTYIVPFPLSSNPPDEWCVAFDEGWNRNELSSTVRIQGSILFLDCALDELQHHTDYLEVCIANANLEYREQLQARVHKEATEKSEAAARRFGEERAVEEALGKLTTGRELRQKKYKDVPGGDGRQKYKGVGGWLLWLCIGLTILGPLISFGALSEEYRAAEQYSLQVPGLMTYVTIECILGALLAVFGFYAGVALWRIRPHAVGAARTYFLLSVVYQVLMISLVPFAGFPSRMQDVLISQGVRNTIAAMGICLIWISYLNRSDRVKKYLRSQRRRDWRILPTPPNMISRWSSRYS